MADDKPIPVPSPGQVKDITKNPKALEDFLFSTVQISADGHYYEPNCALCASIYRAKAEAEWLENRDAKRALDLLRKEGEAMPLTVVKNHMDHHIDQAYVELRKREYVSKILELSQVELDTLGRIELALSSISDRLVSVNATEEPGISPVALDKIKTEATCKLVSSMTSLLQLRSNLLGEMFINGEVFTIRQDDFTKIFNDVLAESNTQETRKIVNIILTKFAQISKKI